MAKRTTPFELTLGEKPKQIGLAGAPVNSFGKQ
jgi:hypothetical protein